MADDSRKQTLAISPKDLWYALNAQEQLAACECFWVLDDRSLERHRETVLERLSGLLRFRSKFLKRKPPSERARLLVRYVPHPTLRAHAMPIMRAWLLQYHIKMITLFLDSLAIPHKGGLIEGNPEAPSLDHLATALNALLSTHERRHVALYVGYLLIAADAVVWRQLPEALVAVSLDVAAVLAGIKAEKEPCEEAAAEEEQLPEINESFTTLDEILIRSMVACALESDYALPLDKVEHLVEEVVELNADRQRTYFHRGFFHALFERELLFDFPGANEERRIWYLCGALFGYLRRAAEPTCHQILKEQRALVRKLLENNRLRCGSMLLPHVYEILRKAEDYGLLTDWLRIQIHGVPPVQRESLLAQVYEDAASLLRRGPSSEAGLLLEVVEQILNSQCPLDPAFIKEYQPLISRKRGQALQLEGDFTQAADLLGRVVDVVQPEDAANTLADLGLIAGGFRSLLSILPRDDESTVVGMCESLSQGMEHYNGAIQRYGKSATNAHCCMGVLDVLSKTEGEEARADHLQCALEGMLKKQDAYAEGGLIDWTRFLLAIALLETADLARFQIATDRLLQSLHCDVKFPMWLWKRALEALQMFDAPRVVEEVAVGLLNSRGQDAFALLRASGLWGVQGLQEPFLRWLIERPEPTIEKWDDLEALLRSLLEGNAFELAGDLLDYMETQAVQEQACRNRFVKFLVERNSLQPVWEESDIATSLVRSHELEGDWPAAAGRLRPIFFRLRDGGEVYHVQEARQIIERIQSYGLGEEHWRDLDGSLRALEQSEEAREGAMQRLQRGEEIRVLYVGGNETQESYADAIESELRQKYPGIQPRFYFPGWNSSWNVDLDSVKRLIYWADVVVVNRLVRTQLGQSIRKLCGSEHPWVGCGGRGKEALMGRMEDAAIWICDIRIRAEAEADEP